MSVTNIALQRYQRGVELLVESALCDTSGSRAAAQVLLSAYNGYDWQLDVTDLCVLDETLFNAAMDVIKGRVETRQEPHELIDNGEAIFKQLQYEWQRYHITNRWRKTCPECAGRGVTLIDPDNHAYQATEPCSTCKGKRLLDELPEPINFDAMISDSR